MDQEPSQHEPGKVVLFEFADFYCSHCHMFERVVGIKNLKRNLATNWKSAWSDFPSYPATSDSF